MYNVHVIHVMYISYSLHIVYTIYCQITTTNYKAYILSEDNYQHTLVNCQRLLIINNNTW